MFRGQMDVVRSKVTNSIDEQIEKILLPLLHAPDLLKNERMDQQQRNLCSEAIGQWETILRSERYKVDRLEASFVVVGTMKAGKSTTINAIIGAEVLPNRNQPMTTLPTVIRHCPGKKEPELLFPDPRPMNELIEQLCHILQEIESRGDLSQLAFCATDDGKALVQRIKAGSFGAICGRYKGQREIFDCLKNINDIWRLCSSEGIGLDIDNCLSQYDDIQKFPAIEIEFAHLGDQDYGFGNGKISFIDTPGPNEAGQVFLKKIMREQLEKASAVLAVLDYTQLNGEADADIRQSLNEAADVTGDRLFVVVNKFDQKDRHGMDAETLRAYVARQLFDGRLDPSHVYPVSSRYGYLAALALRELKQFQRLPEYQFNPWVEDFSALTLGTCWEEEDVDPTELTTRALKLWRNSRFDVLLEEVVKDSYANSASMSLRAALTKMLEYNKRIIESLQLRQNALHGDVLTIEDNIKALNEKIILVETSRDEVRRLIDESIETLEKKIFQLFDKVDKIVTDEIQLVFDRENWLDRRLGPYNKSIRHNHREHYDFSSEEEANQFIDKLIAAGAETIEPQLKEIQGIIEAAVDGSITEVWMGINGCIDKALKAAEKRLNEAFSVTMDFPKPSVQAIEVDFNSLYQSSIREHKTTLVKTKYERKWYTLWCHKHEIVYCCQECAYRVCTQDLVEKLQREIKKDLYALLVTVERYMQNEFKSAINQYFGENIDYLKRFNGDLADAKHDKKLQSEQLETLLVTIDEILAKAKEQQGKLRSVEAILPSPISNRRVG
ncbi:MAG: hypothetical protein H6Q66_2755 [Firmicutes bacterium]|nr:hypothetical protein [Bacillota bacterium]